MPSRKSRASKILVVAVGLGSLLSVVGISAAATGPADGDLTALRDKVFSKIAELGGGAQGFAVGVDPAKRAVRAFVFKSDAAGGVASAVSAAAAAFGPDVTVEQIDGAAVPANDAFSGSVLGRDPRANPAGHCTAGFAVRINALGNPPPSGFLTAGHCLDQTVAENQQTFFAGAASNNIPLKGFQSSMGGSNGADWAILVNDPANDRSLPQINASTGFKTVKGISPPAVGAAICKQGRTTGTTCGTIELVDTRITYGPSTDDRGNPRPSYQVDHAFVTNNCVEGGDSGGPVVSNSGSGDVQAIGIVSGAYTRQSRDTGQALCLEKFGGKNISFMVPFSALPVDANPFSNISLALG